VDLRRLCSPGAETLPGRYERPQRDSQFLTNPGTDLLTHGCLPHARGAETLDLRNSNRARASDVGVRRVRGTALNTGKHPVAPPSPVIRVRYGQPGCSKSIRADSDESWTGGSALSYSPSLGPCRAGRCPCFAPPMAPGTEDSGDRVGHMGHPLQVDGLFVRDRGYPACYNSSEA